MYNSKNYKKFLLFLFILFIVIKIPFDITPANAIETKVNPKLIEFIRGIDIDFETPELIQTCGSMFSLKVTFKKTNLKNFPRFFSASIFLRLPTIDNKEKIIRIGSEPFIFIPSFESEKTVEFNCFTNDNLIENVYSLFSDEKTDFAIDDDAAIGVKIEKIPHWIFWDHFFWNFLRTGKLPFIFSFLSSSPQNNGFLNRKPVTIIRGISFYQILNHWIKSKNPFIEWRDVDIIDPFVCSDKIKFERIYENDICNKTDEEGKFTVKIRIINDLECNITIGILIDISDSPIINTLIPTLEATSYNVGYKELVINGRDYFDNEKEVEINCEFPPGNFEARNYTINVYSGPFIDLDSTNIFGLYYYNYRWKMMIKPMYVVNGSVQDSITKLWYNIPIFNKDGGSGGMFPSFHIDMLYEGNTQSEKFVREVTDTILENYFSLLGLILIFLIPILISILIINLLFKKKFKK